MKAQKDGKAVSCPYRIVSFDELSDALKSVFTELVKGSGDMSGQVQDKLREDMMCYMKENEIWSIYSESADVSLFMGDLVVHLW